MNELTTILPGTRVRTDDGYIGTVERLDSYDPTNQGRPDHLVVRADDAQRSYLVPLMLVEHIAQDTFHTTVTLKIPLADLVYYASEVTTDNTASSQMTSNSTRTADPMASGAPTVDDAQPTQSTSTDTAAHDGVAQPEQSATNGTQVFHLAAEYLTAHKFPHLRESLQIHKGVQTVEQSVSENLSHEEVTIDRIPASDYDGVSPENADDILIPITEEQLVVEKKIVVKEYVRVRKDLLTSYTTVRDSMRHEYLDVTETKTQPDGPALWQATAIKGEGETEI